MQLVHESEDGDRRVLATDVETADSFGDQTKGLMFRTDLPADYALLFRFEDESWLERRLPQSTLDRIPFLGDVQHRFIHMLFVRIPLDVVWLADDEVVRVETLPPWRGIAGARSDAIVELPAGAAADVNPGDRMYVSEGIDGVSGSETTEAESDRTVSSDDTGSPTAESDAGRGSGSADDDAAKPDR